MVYQQNFKQTQTFPWTTCRNYKKNKDISFIQTNFIAKHLFIQTYVTNKKADNHIYNETWLTIIISEIHLIIYHIKNSSERFLSKAKYDNSNDKI